MDNLTVTAASNYFDLQGLEQLRQKTKTNDKEEAVVVHVEYYA